MSNLIAIGYPDVTTARNVSAELAQLTKEQAIVLDDMVVVERRADGKIKLPPVDEHGRRRSRGRRAVGRPHRPDLPSPAARHGGGCRGGRRGGAVTDVGVDDKFMKGLGEHLKEGGAAIVVLVRQSTPDKVLPRISQFGGEVIQSSLDNETEAHLQDALGGLPASS